VIVCTLCEHQQPAGEECDVCGKRFAKDVAIPIQIAPMEGLERTSHAGVDAAGPVATPAAPGLSDWLEPTLAAPQEGALGALEVVPDLEPTRLTEPTAPSSLDLLAGSGLAEAEPSLESWLEPTMAAPIPGAETEEPATFSCRYCRTPAVPGETFCGRCGMRLPASARPTAPGANTPLVCSSCGVPGSPGVCRSCGCRIVAPEP
jgi:hypothetical protein